VILRPFEVQRICKIRYADTVFAGSRGSSECRPSSSLRSPFMCGVTDLHTLSCLQSSDSPAPQVTPSAVKNSRPSTPSGPRSFADGGLAAGTPSLLERGSLLPEHLFRPESVLLSDKVTSLEQAKTLTRQTPTHSCRPQRSWGSVPADFVGTIASPSARYPPSISADTGMEWLYEMVGQDTDSLNDGSRNGSLSPARESPASVDIDARGNH
jgi:hypothetical protein